MSRDIDELERLMGDPVKNHERITLMLRPTLPSVIYKDYTGRQPPLTVGDDNGDGPLFSDEQIDAMAQALADTRNEMRGEFQSMIEEAVGSMTEAVATLQGQVSVLLNLINGIVNNNGNGNGSKMIEAETKTTRKLRVRR